MVLSKTIEPMYSHRSRHREQPIQPCSDSCTLVGYWEIDGVKAHCLLDSGSEGVLLSLEFTQAMGINVRVLIFPIVVCVRSAYVIGAGVGFRVESGAVALLQLDL